MKKPAVPDVRLPPNFVASWGLTGVWLPRHPSLHGPRGDVGAEENHSVDGRAENHSGLERIGSRWAKGENRPRRSIPFSPWKKRSSRRSDPRPAGCTRRGRGTIRSSPLSGLYVRHHIDESAAGWRGWPGVSPAAERNSSVVMPGTLTFSRDSPSWRAIIYWRTPGCSSGTGTSGGREEAGERFALGRGGLGGDDVSH